MERSVVQINGQRFDETYESCRGTVGRTNAREDGEVKKIAIDRLFSKGYEVQRLLEGGLEYFVEWARDQFHDLPSFTDIYASTISAHPPRDFAGSRRSNGKTFQVSPQIQTVRTILSAVLGSGIKISDTIL